MKERSLKLLIIGRGVVFCGKFVIIRKKEKKLHILQNMSDARVVRYDKLKKEVTYFNGQIELIAVVCGIDPRQLEEDIIDFACEKDFEFLISDYAVYRIYTIFGSSDEYQAIITKFVYKYCHNN
ncbi:MAG: hypothetical protein NUV82_01205 [Candidatus Komeilibacteria bacterium]|nr:hypothetical protein [Candidatus Komeilibacteria bacterium]